MLPLFLFVSIRLFAAQIDVMAPMRDGVRLHTLVHTPDGDGPWPALLTRTPYDMTRQGGGARFTSRGYVQVIQNVRGQFKSEGKYTAFSGDIEDGYDAIEWIAKQPWCNGKVGMFGGSAGGVTTNMAAISGAPHLVAAYVTVATGSIFRHAQYPGGVFLKYQSEEWMKGRGVEPSAEPRPLQRVYDADAKRTDMRNHFAKITVPFVNVGGWYDIFDQGNVENFMGLQTMGAGSARGNQKLVMGAFGHGPLAGDIKFPAEGSDRNRIDMLRWFDHWLKGIDNGVQREPAVHYFVMGDPTDKHAPGNVWKTTDRWPPQSVIRPFYLADGGKLSAESPRQKGSDTYSYDPRNPVPTVGGNNLQLPKGPMDQRKVSARPDVLRYETEPLSEPLEIAGQVFAELHVSTDAEDSDFMAKLVDVYPNGYEAIVLDQPFRLRYHDGFDRPSRPSKGKVYPIRIDLWSTALVFNKGHKIALHVSSSNAPRFEPHSNTWDPVTSYDKAVVARNSVHRSPGKASRLLLPVTRDRK